MKYIKKWVKTLKYASYDNKITNLAMQQLNHISLVYLVSQFT